MSAVASQRPGWGAASSARAGASYPTCSATCRREASRFRVSGR